MIISEIFGPTIQGEGPSMGRPCGFVRLGRCNLTCTWCDTSYTWDWLGLNGKSYDPAVELEETSLEAVVNQIIEMAVPMVVITGGEPLLQRRQLTELVTELVQLGLRIEIETNGTLVVWEDLAGKVDQFNVGLKLENSGVQQHLRISPSAIESLKRADAHFKFVVQSVEDLGEIEALQNEFAIEDSKIWVMPEGIDSDQILDAASLIAPEITQRNWNLSTRLHVLLWENKRGV